MDPTALEGDFASLLQTDDRQAAAALLVRAYAADVYALCRALVRDPSTAEDLSQEVFTRAFAALGGFRGEASARTWLLRIARNLCFDHLARLRRQPWVADADEAPDPDVHADDAPPLWERLSQREDAERALEALGEAERAIVVLHFGHGVGYPELAATFDLREGTVRMRVSRALSKMRTALEAFDSPVPAAAPVASRARAAAPFPFRIRPSAPASAPASASEPPTAAPPPPSAPGSPSRGTARADSSHLLRIEAPNALLQRLSALAEASAL